jgi:peptidyl-prolyl cis-trans isomerase C
MSAYLLRTLPAALLLAALAICQPAPVRGAETAVPDTIALVNGVPLTRDLLDVYAQAAVGQHVADVSAAQRAALLDALIRAEIIAQQGDKLGLSANNELDIPDATPAQLAFGRLQAMNQAVVETFEREHQPTDEELQIEYQQRIGRVVRTQYHAHHILVASKEKAESLIKQLKAGASFEALAMKNSLDPSSSRGGDLGWFSLTSLVKPFADAIKAMKSGAISAEPVQTSFGWHVIRLDGIRSLPPPSFESMQNVITSALREAKVQSYIAGLLKGADVQKFN